MDSDGLLAEQRRYYRERAPEYDDWWLRRGAYELEGAEQERWTRDVAEVQDALARFAVAGDVRELAAGTGIWTEQLAPRAARLVAVDSSPETLALNRTRTGDGVDHVVADLFSWEPAETFDVCFFGFWLSHVPESRFDGFWELVDRTLRREGRVFFVDSASPLRGSTSRQTGDETARRRLADGREFEIVKRWFEPSMLAERLAGLGWAIDVTRTAGGIFLVGSGARRNAVTPMFRPPQAGN